MLLLLLACATEPAPADPVARPVACDTAPRVTWASWGQGFFRTWCGACHSAGAQNRNGAPAGMDFDTHEQVHAQLDRIRVRVLEEGTMPLGGGLPDDDHRLLDVLLTCGL